jgi:hypothetical protein
MDTSEEWQQFLRMHPEQHNQLISGKKMIQDQEFVEHIRQVNLYEIQTKAVVSITKQEIILSDLHLT